MLTNFLNYEKRKPNDYFFAKLWQERTFCAEGKNEV